MVTAVVSSFLLLTGVAASVSSHHTRHVELYGKDAVGFNVAMLRGVDKVQQSAPDGGGYFIGLKADPPESPVGYKLSLFGSSLVDPPRTSSYCSGSSFSAFIEGLNCIFDGSTLNLRPDQLEALRMQEPDGKRREDRVKMWGWWNADGFGNHFALVQYSKIGTQIKAEDARPGDFLNISWKSGLGHSVVFLGWQQTEDGKPAVRFWSSQTSTNGFGDLVKPLDSVKEMLFVRVTDPAKLADFDPAAPVDVKAAIGDAPPSIPVGSIGKR